MSINAPGRHRAAVVAKADDAIHVEAGDALRS